VQALPEARGVGRLLELRATGEEVAVLSTEDAVVEH